MKDNKGGHVFPVCGRLLTWNQILMIVTASMIVFTLIQLMYMKNKAGERVIFEFADYHVYREKRLISPLDGMDSDLPSSNVWTAGMDLIKRTETAAMTLTEDCRLLPEWDRLRNTECHAEWINHLKFAKIIDIDLMLGFEKGKRNAFRVVFSDGTYGWYKTCPGQGENPNMEVVGYLMDHFLQFHTMAPAVNRALNIAELEKIVINNGREEYLELIAQTDYICGSGSEFPGVMIGWWEGLEETRSPIKKKEAEAEEVSTIREQWGELVKNTSYPIEDMPRNHALLFMMNILQHQGHNEFRLENGPLVSVDVDRAQFFSKPRSKLDLGLGYLCKMDLRTYTMLQSVNPSYNANTLGFILRKALDKFAPDILFSKSDRDVLQMRIKFLLDAIHSCIDEFGYENVIFDVE